ncbi:MAG: UDP-3-O-[3-hydroxymyristoyl] N-acetylglucosamine deacetylase [Deltaproteobacteria bacterium]|nr:UDP-3-O-[3-hydroxymyristoyl] N-acetylglucosamine deacetylase [Deltaproteobacteria bacterium]
MSKHILIVDDDAGVRETVGAVLGDEGFGVAFASDGPEAIAAATREKPDLVLLDVWLPGMDGIQVLERLRAEHPRLPVVVISGHGNIDTAVRATKLGAVDFIEKPFTIDGLLAAVARALRRVRAGAAADEGETAEGSADDAGEAASPQRPRRAGGPRVRERTVARSVVGAGLGLHSGVRTGIILHPLPPGSGIRFGSVSGGGEVEADVANVDSTGYATTLFKKGLAVRTVEHLMATLHAYGITNLLVKVEGEVPILDGSAVDLCELVEQAGIEEQRSSIPAICVREELRIEPGPDQFLSIRPYDGLRVTYELSYPPPVGDQTYVFEMHDASDFKREIAPARTFGFVEEIRALESAGLGQGGQLGNFILIGEQGIVNTELRFPEELARHKILDILGDFYLLGAPIRGDIHARKTGHSHNVALVRKIREYLTTAAR